MKLIEEKKDLLESKLRDVIAATVQYEHESAETRDLENKKHAEQLEALENVNRQLKVYDNNTLYIYMIRSRITECRFKAQFFER